MNRWQRFTHWAFDWQYVKVFADPFRPQTLRARKIGLHWLVKPKQLEGYVALKPGGIFYFSPFDFKHWAWETDRMKALHQGQSTVEYDSEW